MTWTIISAALIRLWDRFAFYIMAVLFFVGSVLYALIKGRAEGRRKLKEQLAKADKKSGERADKIIRNVERASEKDRNRRMDRWYRD